MGNDSYLREDLKNMALTSGEMDAIMGALRHEAPSEHADGSQYIEGVFVAFAVLGQQVAALNDMVSRLKATNVNHKHMLNQTEARSAHFVECYEALQKKHEAVCRERDAWKKEADDERKSMRGALAIMQERAETAEAKLKEWETAANNSDPYITNGGYVEVEVLEAVKRRNAELLARIEAAEKRAQPYKGSWTGIQDMLNRAGVTQVWQRDDHWFVQSVRTPRTGTGQSLLAAIADLDDVPELP